MAAVGKSIRRACRPEQEAAAHPAAAVKTQGEMRAGAQIGFSF